MLKDIFVTPDYHHCTTHPMSGRYFGCQSMGYAEVLRDNNPLRVGISHRVRPTQGGHQL